TCKRGTTCESPRLHVGLPERWKYIHVRKPPDISPRLCYCSGVRLTPSCCYRAVLARDARYDGRFFTCVRTTGIYCRPICPARPPKLGNCIFVPTAAAAQEAGDRPCRRCRAGGW